MRIGRSFAVGVMLLAALAMSAQTQSAQGIQQPARDTPGQKAKPGAEPTAAISGLVVAADSGRPVRRAHVYVTAPELPGGRGVLTDDSGGFELGALPAGRYTLGVTMAGYISLSYGQRRPLQPGTPIEIADGQRIKGIQFRLPRGSVIAGHISDQNGDPIIGATVRVLRYVYQEGERRLIPAGGSATDDQGSYRVWGLNPGNYYIDAQVRPAFAPGNEAGNEGRVGANAGPGSVPSAQNDDAFKAYAPTYYPGVASPVEARPLALALGQEALGIDFSLQFVRVSRVSGQVISSLGTPSRTSSVMLVPDGMRGGFAVSFGGRVQPDGTFQIVNVPPGRYVLQARGSDSGAPEFASQPLFVSGGDISNVLVTLAEGALASGTVVFEGRTQPANASQVRVSAVPLESSIGGSPQVGVDARSAFIISGIPAGLRMIRLAREPNGWWLKSVTIDNRDVTDSPIELRSGVELEGVTVTLTDRAGEIKGTLTTDKGAPATDYTLLAFTTDRAFWNAQSRFIQTARPDQNGTFRIRGLPAATYCLVAIDPSEPGEWLDPAYLEQQRVRATSVTVGDGETKTQDFKVSFQQQP